MNKFKTCLLIAFLGVFFAFSASAAPADNNSSLLKGKILFDANSLGDFWYVYPGDFHRYHIGTPNDACEIMINFALGVSNADFIKISSSTPDRLKGMFIIKVEDAGRIYYINPFNSSFVYIQNPRDAFYLLRSFSSDVAKDVLKTIPAGTLITDQAGLEISRTWQYLGFWGSVNAKHVPAMAAPNFQAKRLGSFSTINRVKVLAIVRGAGSTWYKIDGGRYPGAYIEAKFISPLPQPAPEPNISLPKTVKETDYWLDLNITKEVLTLFKGVEPILSTYVSTGMKLSPTITGTFNIYYKYKKTRMHGSPPLATHYYDLADVPWTMYYKGSFGIHGAYWHDEFGVPKSSGCTNVAIGDAKFIFDLVGPDIGRAASVRANVKNPGTVVYNHY